MSEKWYWIELIGFDKNLEDFGVNSWLENTSRRATGVSFLMYNLDFVNLHTDLLSERKLSPSECSYAAHRYNEDREIQEWTNWELKKLIDVFHSENVKVVCSFFNNYTYCDENDMPIDGKFCANHPELREHWSAKYLKCRCVNVLKHMNDGSFYEDFLLSKLENMLCDYGFDGIQMSDGISSNRLCIESGDFSDDIVQQFLEHSKLKLPLNISGDCDDKKTLYLARYKHIITFYRYEFTNFMSDRFASYYHKFSEMLSKVDKIFIFNSAWTRDPFEALFRYGIDYLKIFDNRMYAMMSEDTGGSQPLFSESDQGGFRVPDKHRKYCNYEALLMQMSIKAYVPTLEQLTMTSIKDTQENWNLVDNAPNELQRMITRKNNAYIFEEGEFIKASKGAFYCLSDGLNKTTWDVINKNEDLAQTPKIIAAYGVTAIWADENLYQELDLYIKTRKMSSTRINNELLSFGLPIVAMSRFENLEQINTPVLCTHIQFYSAEHLQALEKTERTLIVVGYENPLKRSPSMKITYSTNGLKAWIYDGESSGFRHIAIMGTDSKADTSPFDSFGGIWTARLKVKKAPNKFFEQCVKHAIRLFDLPRVVNDSECKLFSYLLEGGICRVFVSNDSQFAEIPQIKMPFKIKSIKSLTKFDWYKVAFADNGFSIRVNNRAMEILDIEVGEEIIMEGKR